MRNNIIIADDFTGACDVGEKFRHEGKAVEIAFDYTNPCAETIVIDTETRNSTEEAAAEIITNLLEKVNFTQFNCIMKKIDSTLRGNIGVEVRRIAQAAGSEIILFMPAFPKMGRTVEEGILKVYGKPLLSTEFAKDPIKPVTQENIAEFIGGALGRQVTHLSREELWEALDLNNSEIITSDITEQRDLERLVELVKATGKKILYVGTAALAEALAKSEDSRKPKGSCKESEMAKTPEARKEAEETIVSQVALVASLSAKTCDQVSYAKEQGVSVVTVSMEDVLAAHGIEDVYDRICKYLNAGENLIITSEATMNRDIYEADKAKGLSLGLDTTELSSRMKTFMGALGERILKANAGGFFLTGGDTAIGFMERVLPGRIRIIGEIQEGIPILELEDMNSRRIKLITKAGAFGNERAIFESLQWLRYN